MMGETLDEPRDVSRWSKCAGISGQVEQEVCYDAGLFKPSNKRSLYAPGSYTPSSSTTRVSVSAQISSSRYQSLHERARRETSRLSTAPTCPRPTSATSH